MSNGNLGNLKDVLFERLQILNDSTLTGEKLAEELQKNREITALSKEIVSIARVSIDAMKAVDDINEKRDLPAFLTMDK